ncbi:hypothetical protein EDD86DRAFT_245104 [Gorgonomyces haynaldii]|nr:hypothetical protein EDD86DRAFT_245104 [Gorgonomyces haynaldii]
MKLPLEILQIIYIYAQNPNLDKTCVVFYSISKSTMIQTKTILHKHRMWSPDYYDRKISHNNGRWVDLVHDPQFQSKHCLALLKMRLHTKKLLDVLLEHAISQKSTENVEFIISLNELQPNDYNKHLVNACLFNMPKMGADVHFDTDAALAISCKRGYHECVEICIQNGSDIHSNDDYPICISAKQGNIQTVRLLVNQGCQVNAKNGRPVQWAAEYGHTEVVKFLIETGADIHQIQDYPLRWAATRGHLPVVKLLLESGAFVHASDDFALRHAVKMEHLDIVELLLDYGADPHAVDTMILYGTEYWHQQLEYAPIVAYDESEYDFPESPSYVISPTFVVPQPTQVQLGTSAPIPIGPALMSRQHSQQHSLPFRTRQLRNNEMYDHFLEKAQELERALEYTWQSRFGQALNLFEHRQRHLNLPQYSVHYLFLAQALLSEPVQNHEKLSEAVKRGTQIVSQLLQDQAFDLQSQQYQDTLEADLNDPEILFLKYWRMDCELTLSIMHMYNALLLLISQRSIKANDFVRQSREIYDTVSKRYHQMYHIRPWSSSPNLRQALTVIKNQTKERMQLLEAMYDLIYVCCGHASKIDMEQLMKLFDILCNGKRLSSVILLHLFSLDFGFCLQDRGQPAWHSMFQSIQEKAVTPIEHLMIYRVYLSLGDFDMALTHLIAIHNPSSSFPNRISLEYAIMDLLRLQVSEAQMIFGRMWEPCEHFYGSKTVEDAIHVGCGLLVSNRLQGKALDLPLHLLQDQTRLLRSTLHLQSIVNYWHTELDYCLYFMNLYQQDYFRNLAKSQKNGSCLVHLTNSIHQLKPASGFPLVCFEFLMGVLFKYLDYHQTKEPLFYSKHYQLDMMDSSQQLLLKCLDQSKNFSPTQKEILPTQWIAYELAELEFCCFSNKEQAKTYLLQTMPQRKSYFTKTHKQPSFVRPSSSMDSSVSTELGSFLELEKDVFFETRCQYLLQKA